MRHILSSLLLYFSFTLCAFADVQVFAAASMKGALDEMATLYTAKSSHHINITYAASGALARQIEQGAPADIFISADQDWMDFLSSKGLIKTETRYIIAGNRLVLVANHTQPAIALADLPQNLGSEKLALGEVNSVPAGKYAKAALQNLKLWAAVESQVVMQDNVRSALSLVARGEAKFGVTYASDAKAEAKVHVVASFPQNSHAHIQYPSAIVSSSTNLEALDFNNFLTSQEAQDVFAAAGFE